METCRLKRVMCKSFKVVRKAAMAKTVVTVWLQVTASPKLTVANGFSFTIATILSISFDLIM